jgi:hypothetical protein
VLRPGPARRRSAYAVDDNKVYVAMRPRPSWPCAARSFNWFDGRPAAILRPAELDRRRPRRWRLPQSAADRRAARTGVEVVGSKRALVRYYDARFAERKRRQNVTQASAAACGIAPSAVRSPPAGSGQGGCFLARRSGILQGSTAARKRYDLAQRQSGRVRVFRCHRRWPAWEWRRLVGAEAE